MTVLTVLTFLAVDTVAGSYGTGATLEDAVGQCKRGGGNHISKKVAMTVFLFDCERSKVKLRTDVNLRYETPPDVTVMRFTAVL